MPHTGRGVGPKMIRKRRSREGVKRRKIGGKRRKGAKIGEEEAKNVLNAGEEREGGEGRVGSWSVSSPSVKGLDRGRWTMAEDSPPPGSGPTLPRGLAQPSPGVWLSPSPGSGPALLTQCRISL